MADEATVTAPVEAPAVSGRTMSSEIPSSSLSLPQPAAAATDPTESVETNGETSTIPKQDAETAGPQATTEVNAPDGDTTEIAEAPSAAATDDNTPQALVKKGQRKSLGGAGEHKNKKFSKKKVTPTLHLDCKPGEFYWARLKGYPPWPAVICDEQMLPESLLATRPVSTARPDGSIRDDFKEGGKNAKERTFPIMFLATNEFTWMVNTALEPLDPKDCEKTPTTKMTKALRDAWQIASENRDLDHFKGVLKIWQEEEAEFERRQREEEEQAAKEAEERAAREAEEAANAANEEASAKKKKPRKSKGGDGDVEMADGETPKSSKKRKKDAESDAEGAKPKKTPKVTKLNAPKTPNGDSTTKKSATKSKKKVVQAPKDDDEEVKPQMTEEERMQTREKAVLYLRHRLQKGFLSRDQAPQEGEMAAMADFFSQLESYENLEASIIRTTKVHKVLKAIVKLSSVPKDEEFHFKKRSAAMLEVWNKRMEGDNENAPPSATETKPPAVIGDKAGEKVPQTNGDKPEARAASTEPLKEDNDAKEGAEKEIEAKTVDAAEKLDEKVEAAKEEERPEPPEPTAVEEKTTAPATTDVEMGDADAPANEAAKVESEATA